MKENCPLIQKIFSLNHPCLCQDGNQNCGFTYSAAYDCYFCKNLLQKNIILEESTYIKDLKLIILNTRSVPNYKE